MKNALLERKIKTLRSSLIVLGSMTHKNVKRQYRDSFLGVLWTVLNPVLQAFVMAFVFGTFLGGSVGKPYPEYAGPEVVFVVYILAGQTVFGLMLGATRAALPSIVRGRGLIDKVALPMSVLPISENLTSLVNFGFAFVALVVIQLSYMGVMYTTAFALLLFLPSLIIFSLGISLVLASIFVFFRDIDHIYSVVASLWMYLTPLFYSVTQMKDDVAKIIKLNPMYHYVDTFRYLMVYGEYPVSWKIPLCYAMGLVSLALGVLIFNLTKKKFVLYI